MGINLEIFWSNKNNKAIWIYFICLIDLHLSYLDIEAPLLSKLVDGCSSSLSALLQIEQYNIKSDNKNNKDNENFYVWYILTHKLTIANTNLRGENYIHCDGQAPQIIMNAPLVVIADLSHKTHKNNKFSGTNVSLTLSL